MQSEFIFEISEIIRKASDEDFEYYLIDERSFFRDYAHLREGYDEYKTKRPESWSAILREIRLWKDLDLRYMYSRIMELTQDYKGNFDYFEILTDYGVYVVPDRITLLNKLLQLSRELLNEIYPTIEQSLNYESDTLSVDSPTIRGKIDWNTTLTNTINKSLKFPISFVSIVPTQEFETPENVLLLVSLFWIKNDSLRLMRHYQPGELSKKELSKLNKIFTTTELALEHTMLKHIQDNVKYLSEIGQKHRKISELTNQVRERLNLGLINQLAYSELLTWIVKYLHFNTERFAKDLVNFRIERTQDVDTMYELWILFEIMRYLDSNFIMDFQPIVESKNSFHGFEITLNGKKFKLKYQESYPGQIHAIQRPDYTLERTKNDVPIVLDAKNWRKEKTDAKDKMIVYLVDLSPKNTKKGILFFPNNVRLEENKDTPFFEKSAKVGNHEMSLITCVLRPSSEQEVQNQNKIVFEKIAQIINNTF